MSSRYGIVALVLGLALAVPLHAQENVSHPEGYPASAQEQSTEQPTVEPAPVEPAITPPTDEAGPKHNQDTPTDSNDKPYQYPDIILGDGWAQWAMVVLSFFALCVSAWAVWLLKDTLKATRDAVRSADDAVEVTRDMGMRQTRAYIGVSQTDVRLNLDKCVFYVEVINSGASPAYDMTHWIRANGTGNATFSEDIDAPPKQSLGPGQSMYVDIGFDGKFPEDGGGGKVVTFGHPVYVWGRVDYIDAFDVPRFTRYRFELVQNFGKDGFVLTPCMEGNEAT